MKETAVSAHLTLMNSLTDVRYSGVTEQQENIKF